MKLNNTYYLLRHGEAISNAKQLVSSWPEKFHNPLTQKGAEQVKNAAKKLKNKKIDMIFSSDLLRTKQTAEIVGKALGVKPEFDKRLREIDFGVINGRPAEELLYLKFEEGKLNHAVKKSENYEDVLKRVSNFIKSIDKKYKGNLSASSGQAPSVSSGRRNILLISHQCPLWILENYVQGFTLAEGLKRTPKNKRINKGEIRKLK